MPGSETPDDRVSSGREAEQNTSEAESKDSSKKSELGADEVYCTSCGESIKQSAEICPHCGVRQNPTATTPQQSQSGSLPQPRVYELQKIASKDITTVIVVSLLLTPAGYWMVGKTGLAIINFLTFNYFLLGFIIVPLHTRKIIKDARMELEHHGETW